MEDLLKENFIQGINMEVIKTNFRLQKLVLGGIFIYSVLECIEWLSYLNLNHASPLKESALLIYVYRFFPIIALVVIILDLTGFVLLFQGHRLILDSIEGNEAALFNKGYGKFKKSGIFILCALSLAIPGILIRFFLQ